MTTPKTLETAMSHLDYLASRWSDEKEYEDFADYITSMKNNLPDGAEFVSMTKRPIRVDFKINGKLNRLEVRRNAIHHLIQK